jgi:hypothetical protein
MITLSRSAKLVGFHLDELAGGVAPAPRHHALLKSYLFSLHRGRAAVLRMVIGDLRACLDIGADRCAADLVIVLRLFLSQRREISRASRRQAVTGFERAVSNQRRAADARPPREHAATPLGAALQ